MLLKCFELGPHIPLDSHKELLGSHLGLRQTVDVVGSSDPVTIPRQNPVNAVKFKN